MTRFPHATLSRLAGWLDALGAAADEVGGDNIPLRGWLPESFSSAERDWEDLFAEQWTPTANQTLYEGVRWVLSNTVSTTKNIREELAERSGSVARRALGVAKDCAAAADFVLDAGLRTLRFVGRALGGWLRGIAGQLRDLARLLPLTRFSIDLVLILAILGILATVAFGILSTVSPPALNQVELSGWVVAAILAIVLLILGATAPKKTT
jgi:hypothetical protein